ncbi:hypothetical protein SM757_20510, partial [Azohydromonas lata]|nr:hypothetical protein [Azohydromonas lata]
MKTLPPSRMLLNSNGRRVLPASRRLGRPPGPAPRRREAALCAVALALALALAALPVLAVGDGTPLPPPVRGVALPVAAQPAHRAQPSPRPQPAEAAPSSAQQAPLVPSSVRSWTVWSTQSPQPVQVLQP